MFKMSKTYYLKTRDVYYTTQKSFKNRLQKIRDEHKTERYISNPDYIADLQDFLEDYHPSKEFFINNYDIRNCHFFVSKSPDYQRNYSLYIQDDEKQNSFSVEKFSETSTLANFSQACSFILQNKKLEKKLQLMTENNLSGNPSDYQLIHVSPKFNEIINQFIQKYNLREILSDVVSENGLGNNAPFFNEKYQYLKDEFLKFYDSLDLEYELQG